MKKTERLIFDCIDGYTAGNPVRLVKSPSPVLNGSNMGEKRVHFVNEYDWIRTGLMFEPRGHDMMSGSFYYKPQDPENDDVSSDSTNVYCVIQNHIFGVKGAGLA